MNSVARRLRAPLLAFLGSIVLGSVLAPHALGGSLWMPRDGRYAVSLEMLRPSIEGVDAEAFSSAFYLSGRYAATPTFAVVAEFPYARFDGRDLGYYYGYPYGYGYTPYGYILPGALGPSASTIGNPYIGFEASVPSTPIFVEVGGRPPLASDREFDAQLLGAVADFTRLFAFPDDYASVQFGFNLYEVAPSGISYRARISPLIAIATETYLDTELFALYSVQVGYQGRVVRGGMGLAGLVLVTDDYPRNLGERSATQLEFHADFLPGAIRPGLDVHLPLDTPAYRLPVVLGASVTWAP